MANISQYHIIESDTIKQLRSLVDQLNRLLPTFNCDADHNVTIGDLTNNIRFAPDGSVLLNGTVQKWDDVYMGFASAKLPAANYPDWTTFTTNTSAYTFKVNDYADLSTIELPHTYKEGSDIEVHLHIATNGTAAATYKARYIIYYTYALPDSGTNQFTAESSLTAELTIPSGNPTRSSFYLSFGTISGATMIKGTQIKFRVKRIASTGTEPEGNPYLGMVGIHFLRDSFGSATMLR